ncbi:MAG: FHA domain-containing protein [Myxococcota bacterium]|nr:FHA domain-containing protein [Myxococcota bacterium]
MRLEIEHGGARTQVELRDGIFTFGGGSTDQVHLPGVSPGQLATHIEGPQVVVEAGEPLAFDGVLTPPGVRRLWLPQEVIELGEGVRLRRLREETAGLKEGTVALLQGLFEGEGQLASHEGPTLTCLTGLDLGRVFPVVDGITEIGRGAKVGLRIRDRSVSRRHARILREQGRTRLEDLGSPNGVFVGGRRASRPRTLKDGDLIEIGTALLKFSCPHPTPPPAPAPEAPPQLPPPSPPPELGSEWSVLVGALVLAVIGALMTWRLTG